MVKRPPILTCLSVLPVKHGVMTNNLLWNILEILSVSLFVYLSVSFSDICLCYQVALHHRLDFKNVSCYVLSFLEVVPMRCLELRKHLEKV